METQSALYTAQTLPDSKMVSGSAVSIVQTFPDRQIISETAPLDYPDTSRQPDDKWVGCYHCSDISRHIDHK